MRDSLIVFVFFAVGVALGYADAVRHGCWIPICR